MQSKAIDRQAELAQPQAKSGRQTGIIQFMAFIARQPFDNFQDRRPLASAVRLAMLPLWFVVDDLHLCTFRGWGGGTPPPHLPGYLSNVVRWAPSSATKTANRLAGSVALVFSLTRCSLPAGSKKVSPAL